MAISFFGSSSNPADNSALPTVPGNTVFSVTPPASMQTGDLVLFCCCGRNNNSYFGIGYGDGQDWTEIIARRNNSFTLQVFQCRFNGTWNLDPFFYCNATNSVQAISLLGASNAPGTGRNYSGILLVFRPTATTNSWFVDTAPAHGAYVAPSSPFTVTVPSITTLNANAVAVALWGSTDDNTWGNLSGAGWVQIGTQWRNTQSAQLSFAAAYKLMPATGATGAVSLDQLTVGGDAGVSGGLSYYEA